LRSFSDRREREKEREREIMAEVGDDGPDEPAVGSGDGNERHHRAPHGTRRTTGGLVDDEVPWPTKTLA
jgi:hypothetical protein